MTYMLKYGMNFVMWCNIVRHVKPYETNMGHSIWFGWWYEIENSYDMESQHLFFILKQHLNFQLFFFYIVFYLILRFIRLHNFSEICRLNLPKFNSIEIINMYTFISNRVFPEKNVII